VASTVFSDDPGDEAAPELALTFSDPDSAAPEVNTDAITVTAAPTNPNAPNGETQVTIAYEARDDKSGLGKVSYRLLDPQGGSHHQYHYHPDFYTDFFEGGDPTVYATYTISAVLPPGSAPGVWGLESMEVYDKVDNRLSLDFTELMNFDVDEEGRRRRRLGDGEGGGALSFVVRYQ